MSNKFINPDFINTYINKVKQYKTIDDALFDQSKVLLGFFVDTDEAWGNHAYAAEKWTVKQVWQHIIDTERIFAYRALCIARNEQNTLLGFDENEYSEHAFVGHRSLENLYQEFKAVRASTIYLVQSFTDGQLKRKGKVSSYEINVNALLYAIAGHAQHHLDIIDERYRARN